MYVYTYIYIYKYVYVLQYDEEGLSSTEEPLGVWEIRQWQQTMSICSMISSYDVGVRAVGPSLAFRLRSAYVLKREAQRHDQYDHSWASLLESLSPWVCLLKLYDRYNNVSSEQI